MILLGAAATWAAANTYGEIFRRYTATEAGSYSDFSQTWVGTQVALFEHGDPYSPAIQPRIQIAYYGHVLREDDPHRPDHPQGFYYPLYIVWLTWPFALLPFPVASILFKIVTVILVTAGSYGYLTLLNWPSGRAARLLLAAGALLTAGGQAMFTADQPTVLLVGLLLGAVYAAGRGRFALAGCLLALAWIKPQLAVLPTLGLGLWLVWRPERRPALVSAALTGALLLGSSLLLLPGWIGSWMQTFEGYATVTSGFGGFSQYGLGDWIGLALRAGLAGGVLLLWWRARRESFTGMAVMVVLAATFVVTVAIQQPWFVYNLILLTPPIYLLLAVLDPSRPAAAGRPPRLLSKIAVTVFAAPWAIYLLLDGAYLAGLMPASGLDWPSFAAQFLLTQRILGAFTILTLVFAYLAWVGPALYPSPPGTPRPADQPSAVLTAREDSITNRS
jgi:hypothetical protein